MGLGSNLCDPGTSGSYLLLEEAELDALFGLFTIELNEIYSSEMRRNEQATVDEPASDDESRLECRGLEVARGRLSIVVYPFVDDPLRAAGFYFDAPRVLEIETAEMLIHSDGLRARVRSEIR